LIVEHPVVIVEGNPFKQFVRIIGAVIVIAEIYSLDIRGIDSFVDDQVL